MTLIVITIVGAMIVGLLAGGSFRNFPSIPLGWWSLAIVGVVLQFLPLTGSAGSWTLTASFVLLIAFALLNFRAPGFILIFTGLLLNAIVIVANHGMPVAPRGAHPFRSGVDARRPSAERRIQAPPRR